MATALPGWGRWLNAVDLAPTTLSLALGLGCRAVAVLWGAITPASVRRANDAGLEVAAWTVRRTATRDRLERLGDRRVLRRGRGAGSRAMTARDLVLEAGDVRAVVHPEDGGRIGSLVVDGLELIWNHRPDGPIRWGSYPMAPWAGRTRHGRFEYGGRRLELPLSMPPHAIHGVVYDRPWSVVADDEIAIDLDDRWPFRGRVTQRFHLDSDGLEVTMALEADEPMPAVLGWHPWFRRTLAEGDEPVRLRLEAGSMLVRDPEGIPTGARTTPSPGPWDDAFTDLASEPELTWPGRLRLSISSTLHVVGRLHGARSRPLRRAPVGAARRAQLGGRHGPPRRAARGGDALALDPPVGGARLACRTRAGG